MALSKVKSKTQKARLQARISDWERIPGGARTAKKLRINKAEFTKPGSNKK